MISAGSAPWTLWNQDRICDAARVWQEKHGKPPAATDWRRAAPEHPNDSTVRRVFGTWNAMIAAAGMKPRRACRPKQWTRKQVEQLIFEFVLYRGRLPMFADWLEPGVDRPTSRQLIQLYGSWNAAIVAAGYEPRIAYRSLDGYRRQAGAMLRERDADGVFT